MVPLDAGMIGVCSQANSAHCARWPTAWSNCKLRLGYVDTTFLQQNGAYPHIQNVILDVLHDVFGSHVHQIYFQNNLTVGGPGHHVRQTW